MATDIPPVSTSDGNSHLPIMTTALLCPNPNLRKKKAKKKQKKKKKKTQMVGQANRNEVSN